MSENLAPSPSPRRREFLFKPTIFAKVTSVLMQQLVSDPAQKFSSFCFVLVSAVVLLSVTGCAADKEVGLCTYLFGCGSAPYGSDPGVHHDTPYDYGTYDDGNDDDDDGK